MASAFLLSIALLNQSPEAPGVEVIQVAHGSVAERAGIAVGDIIREFDHRPVWTPTSLRLHIRNSVRQGLLSIKLRGRTLTINPADLEFPRSAELFGVLTVPKLSKDPRDLALKAFELLRKDRAAAGKLAIRAGELAVAQNDITGGYWLKLAGIRTDWQGPESALMQVTDMLKHEQAIQDKALVADLVHSSYYWDTRYDKRNPKHPEMRPVLYKCLRVLADGGWPISAGTLGPSMAGGVFDDAPFGVGFQFTIAAINSIEGHAGSDGLSARLAWGIPWGSSSMVGRASNGIPYGTDGFLEVARRAKAAHDKGIDMSCQGDLGWDMDHAYGQPSFDSRQLESIRSLEARARAYAAWSEYRSLNFSRAEELANASLDYLKSWDGENAPDPIWGTGLTTTRLCLGMCAVMRGDLEAAQFHLDRCPPGDFSRDHLRLAILVAKGDEEGAFSLAQKIYARDNWNSKKEDLTSSSPVLVPGYLKRRQIQGAESVADRNLSFTYGALDRHGLIRSQAHRLMGQVREAQGRDEDALKEYLKADAATIGFPQAHPVHVEPLMLYGTLAGKMGRDADAIKVLEKAYDLSRRYADSVKGELSRQYVAGFVAEAAGRYVEVLAKTGRSLTALQTLEDARGQALLRLMSSQSGSRADQTAFAKYLELSEASERAENLALTAERRIRELNEEQKVAEATERYVRDIGAPQDGLRTKDQISKDIAAAKEEATKLKSEAEEARLRADAASVEALREAGLERKALDVDTLKASISPGTVYVAYSSSTRGTTVVCVDHSGSLLAERLAVDGPQLSQRISAFRSLVTDRRSSLGAVQKGAAELFAVLFPGKIGSLVSAARALIVSPEGELWGVPFAALQTVGTDKKPVWLGVSRPISYVLSLTVALKSSSNGGGGTGALVVGDPIFTRGTQTAKRNESDVTTRVWGGATPPPPLPATAIEAKKVADLYGVKPLLGEEATERKARSLMGNVDVIHLATHGYMSPEYPLASGVLLTAPASVASPDDDGALQAAEVARRLRLRAKLVVLSACETARGKTLQGEGVQGLVRAFLVAGSRAVMASQWKVADDSTADLMVAFHTAFKGGSSSPVSLQKAMSALVTKRPHPYYWSPFGVYGGF